MIGLSGCCPSGRVNAIMVQLKNNEIQFHVAIRKDSIDVIRVNTCEIFNDEDAEAPLASFLRCFPSSAANKMEEGE